MKPEQAIQLVDSALATLQVNRQTHVELQKAMMVIREAIKPKAEKDKKV